MSTAHVCMLVVASIAWSAGPAVARQDSRPPGVHLSIDQRAWFTDQQIEIAVEEVRQIWGRAGIAVSSGPYGAPSQPHDARVSVWVVTTPARYRANGLVVLGWVARDADGSLAPTLFISLSGIAGLFSEYRVGSVKYRDLPASLRDRIVARSVGRVAAHELGHFLLEMTVHPATGLMRSEYLARDLFDPEIGPFLLGARESMWLRREVMTLALAQGTTR